MTSRYLATNFFDRGANPCQGFLSTVESVEWSAEICKQWDFRTLDDVRLWYGALAFGKESSQYQALREITLISEANLDALFDLGNGAFGSQAAAVRREISSQFGCANAAECTNNEIAVKQFLSGEVTNTIIAKYAPSQSEYLVQSPTLKEGWDYHRNVAMEYSSFCDEDKQMTPASWSLISNPVTGLANFDEMFMFARKMVAGAQEDIDAYTTRFGIDATDLFKSLRWIVQESLLGGLYMTRPFEDLIEGYSEPNLSFLQEGEFTEGADPSVQTFVSINKIFRNTTLVTENTNYEIFTGHKHVE
jgi:hypothetical protein